MEDKFFGLFKRYTSLDVVPSKLQSSHVHFVREKNSHKGLSRFSHIKVLSANNVNQGFLDEICKLENLTSLTMKIVTAENLCGLSNLRKLRKIRFQAAHQTDDFSFISSLPHLKALYIAHAKQLSDLKFLSSVQHLERVGVEGSTSALQKIESLEPLSGMQGLKELYLRSVQLRDKNLTYLSKCANLKKLECARFAPRESFEKLREAMPHLKCEWCDKYDLPKRV